MKIKLKQAFNLQMGKTPARNRPDYWNGENKWISIADIGNTGKFLVKTKESITEAGIEGSGIKVVPQGPVIMSFKLSIGKTAITSEDMYTNEAIMAFIDNGKFAVDTDYLYHLCCGTNWTAGTNKAVMGLILNKATLLEKEIPLPDINEQHEIATKLDKIDAIIAERQQQLELIDQLVKSRFIELFGDQTANPYAWQQTTIGACCTLKSGTSLPADKENEGGAIPYVKVGDMNYPGNEQYITTSSRFVSEQTAGAGVFPVGTVVFPKRGGAIGTNKKRLTRLPICADLNVMGVTAGRRLTPQYLMAYFNTVDLGTLNNGSSVPQINNKDIAPLLICIPPMALQEQFAAFVEQTDKSKYYSSLSFRYCQAAENAYRQEWITCRTSDF